MSRNRIMMFGSIIFIMLIGCQGGERCVEVIDGDTFRTQQGTTVRLLGINAPEITDPGGDIAKDLLTFFILNKDVRLDKDITDQDDYGRCLRYLFVDGKFINAELVRLGYAETRFFPPDTLYRKELEELEKVAIRNRRGLWSFSIFQTPDTALTMTKALPDEDSEEVISWRDAHKHYGEKKIVEGTIVVSNNTGKVCFLNFHENWKKYFTAVIFSSDFSKFPSHPEDHYLNRKVRVKGLIKKYKGKPEIILKSPSQIEIVK